MRIREFIAVCSVLFISHIGYAQSSLKQYRKPRLELAGDFKIQPWSGKTKFKYYRSAGCNNGWRYATSSKCTLFFKTKSPEIRIIKAKTPYSIHIDKVFYKKFKIGFKNSDIFDYMICQFEREEQYIMSNENSFKIDFSSVALNTLLRGNFNFIYDEPKVVEVAD
jgi:hypothetical protein